MSQRIITLFYIGNLPGFRRQNIMLECCSLINKITTRKYQENTNKKQEKQVIDFYGPQVNVGWHGFLLMCFKIYLKHIYRV